MHRQDRRESLASELPDHLDDPGLVVGMPDQATKVRCVELTVCTWRSLDLIEQFTLFWINRILPHMADSLAVDPTITSAGEIDDIVFRRSEYLGGVSSRSGGAV